MGQMIHRSLQKGAHGELWDNRLLGRLHENIGHILNSLNFVNFKVSTFFKTPLHNWDV